MFSRQSPPATRPMLRPGPRWRVYSTSVLTADPGDSVVDLTRQLVAFDSVNPGLVPGAAGEGPIAQFVADRLSGSTP
jgi:hypothetical protein